MLFKPKDDLEYSMRRLNEMLGRRRIRFNPYSVSDKQLLEYAWECPWGEPQDLTQMVILTFTRLHEADNEWGFDGIMVRVGRAEEEYFKSNSFMACRQTAHDTLNCMHHQYGKSVIRNVEDIKRLVGKTVFVSRTITTCRLRNYGAVYKMNKLTGNLAKDAAMIRREMCEAKIEMLERLMARPESTFHLNCRKGFFDYETPIRALIEKIRRYPQTPIPPSE